MISLAAGSLIQGAGHARSASAARNGAVIAAVDQTIVADQIKDVHGDMNLFSFRPGGEVVQLTDTPEDDYAPAMSPDGRLVAFTRGLPAEGANGDIWVLDTTIGEARNLTETPTVHDYAPSWSPDGELIVFTRADTPGGDLSNDDLYVVAADGSNEQRLTDEPGVEMGPEWSPDGRSIAYLEHGLGGPYGTSSTSIHIVDADGSSNEIVFTDSRYLTTLAWSPDGAKLAVTMVPGGAGSGNYGIWTLNRDGSNFSQLLPLENVRALLGTWSPDGEWIAFVGSIGGADGTTALYKMRPDGSRVTRITALDLKVASIESYISGTPWKIDWGPRP